jgi:hypothetical protein
VIYLHAANDGDRSIALGIDRHLVAAEDGERNDGEAGDG